MHCKYHDKFVSATVIYDLITLFRLIVGHQKWRVKAMREKR